MVGIPSGLPAIRVLAQPPEDAYKMSFQPSFFAGPRHSVANRVPVQPSHVRPGSGAAQITLLGAALTTPGSPRHACITAGLRAVIGGQGQCLTASANQPGIARFAYLYMTSGWSNALFRR